MSDKTWDRFKRAFGADPSDSMVNSRESRVQAALTEMNVKLGHGVDAGVDLAVLQGLRDEIRDRRTAAQKLANKSAKTNALETLALEAEGLRDRVDQEVDRSLTQLAGELQRARRVVETPIREAEAFTVPLCKTATAAALKAVKDEYDLAMAKANDTLRCEALEDIDTKPLTDLMVDAKQVQNTTKSLTIMVNAVNANLTQLPDNTFKTDVARRLKLETDRQPALAQETDMAELLRRSKEIGDMIAPLISETVIELSRHEKRQAALTTLRHNIGIVVDQGDAVTSKLGIAVVKAALDQVKADAANAELKAVDQAKIDDLTAIDLKPLVTAVASAKDIDGGVPKLLEGLATVIGKLPNGTKKTGFDKQRTELDQLCTALLQGDDPETVRKGFASLRLKGDALMDAVLDERGDAGYEEALKARFGVDVTTSPNAKMNMAGAYEMLALVPASHIGHDKLKKLHFTASKDGGGAYLNGVIDMDNFGSGNDGYVYEVAGKKVKPNGFNVCMLHEIGHAVDDKYKIMPGLMETAGYGDWKAESKASVQAELTTAALAAMGNPADPLKSLVGPLIAAALDGKEAKKPAGASRKQWKALEKYTDIAVAITEKKKPWFNAKPGNVEVGGRVYVQSYGSEWHSYGLGEHAGSNVRDYQWRSPAEWFADLYGVLWMTKKPAPSGVGPALARWMPG